MPRPATHSTLTHHHNLLLLCILALFVVLGLLGFKYLLMRQTWREHAVVLQEGIQKGETANSIEDGSVLGATVVMLPTAANPLLKQPALLQKYVSAISSQTGRDIVVVDKNEKILADTVAANIGKEFTEDKDNQVKQTIFDGTPRTFIEKGVDYPNGINQTVVQMKNAAGTIVGAVIISSSAMYK